MSRFNIPTPLAATLCLVSTSIKILLKDNYASLSLAPSLSLSLSLPIASRYQIPIFKSRFLSKALNWHEFRFLFNGLRREDFETLLFTLN
jgi:hypothetical protein